LIPFVKHYSTRWHIYTVTRQKKMNTTTMRTNVSNPSSDI
jgi:hypothetical protein